MNATKEQLAEWKAKYGTFYMLETDDGLVAYIFDPLQNLAILKLSIAAMMVGTFEYIDCLLANCWIDGDNEIKDNDQIKMSLADQVADLVNLPDPDVQFLKDEAIITVEGKSITVRLASRQDIKFAESRNKKGKPLDTQKYLLERIAKDDLTEWRKDNRAYVGLLLAMDQVKKRKYVNLKKF